MNQPAIMGVALCHKMLDAAERDAVPIPLLKFRFHGIPSVSINGHGTFLGGGGATAGAELRNSERIL
jgi:hypothetical protein